MSDGYEETYAELWEGLKSFLIGIFSLVVSATVGGFIYFIYKWIE